MQNSKSIIAAVAVLVLIFSIYIVITLAADSEKPISVQIDGKAYTFDPPPMIVNDRTMVPMRAIFENLGAKVTWDEKTNSVIAFKVNTTVVLQIGSTVASVNGKEITLDSPAMLYNDRTMVPLRFVGEALGYNVFWIEEKQQVVISKKIPTTFEKRVYKTVGGKDFHIYIYKPVDFSKDKKYPAIAFFHGGGWKQGDVDKIRPFAVEYAAKGFVTALVEYRLQGTDKITTAIPCISDGKSSIRWLRQHAEEFSIDPNRIIASGGSAGGHVALSTSVFDTFDEQGEDLSVSSKPNALILYNPVVNTLVNKGFMTDEKVLLSISPYHHATKDVAPMVIFHGTNDQSVPIKTIEDLQKKVQELGGVCILHKYPGKGHGFFNEKTLMPDLTNKGDAFLDLIRFFE
ncbi:MAG: Lipase 2 [Firmicutes bacterium ADurb.Bin193]|nr:MAG: Lipase 2 [Firmicutes bacterium ADurb.Bin193]